VLIGHSLAAGPGVNLLMALCWALLAIARAALCGDGRQC